MTEDGISIMEDLNAGIRNEVTLEVLMTKQLVITMNC